MKATAGMDEPFDPYHKWLGIRDPQRPPNHYRLLGLDLFEDHADVIALAADRQMSHLRTFQVGPQAPLSQRLLNECAAARVCLLNPQRKAAYDAELHAELAPPAAVEFQPAPSELEPPTLVVPPLPETIGPAMAVPLPRGQEIPAAQPIVYAELIDEQPATAVPDAGLGSVPPPVIAPPLVVEPLLGAPDPLAPITPGPAFDEPASFDGISVSTGPKRRRRKRNDDSGAIWLIVIALLLAALLFLLFGGN